MRSVLGGVAIALLALSATPARAGSDVVTSPPAGMRASVDPRTGALVRDPADEPVEADPRFSTSTDGLVVVPAPGGGVMLDLQGRFTSSVTATVGADGEVRIDCHTGAPPAR